MKLIRDPKTFNFDLIIHNEYYEYGYSHDLDLIDGGGKFYIGWEKYSGYTVDVRDSGAKFCYYEDKLVKIINKDGTNRKLH